jgi:DNA-binding response OmpR family regulator
MPEKAVSARTPGLRRVLVVEDQELLSEVIAEGLAPAFEVMCAATVADGVEWMMAEAVDVVLLDCVLPGGTMWQIVLEADRQNVPVVLMTGDPVQMREAAAGTRPYIFKPFSLSDLKRVLEDAAVRKTGGDTPAFVGRSAFLSEPDPSCAH